MGTAPPPPGVLVGLGVKLIIRLHLVTKLSMLGAIRLLGVMSIKHTANFTSPSHSSMCGPVVYQLPLILRVLVTISTTLT
jgi:hypothetical protein